LTAKPWRKFGRLDMNIFTRELWMEFAFPREDLLQKSCGSTWVRDLITGLLHS